MDPNKSGSHGDYGVSPPPYSSSYPGGGYQVSTMANSLCSFCAILFRLFKIKASCLTCVLMSGDQVGPGNISVVSPPGPCANGAQAHFAGAAGHQQYADAPPEYSDGFDDGAFDDRAVRRGEPGLKEGSEEGGRPFTRLLC